MPVLPAALLLSRCRALGRLGLAPLPLLPAPVRPRARPVARRRFGGVLRITARFRDQFGHQLVQGLDLRVLRLSPSLERRDHSVLRRLTRPPLADQRGLTLDPRQQLRHRLPGRRHLLGSGLHDPGTYTPSGTCNHTGHATP